MGRQSREKASRRQEEGTEPGLPAPRRRPVDGPVDAIAPDSATVVPWPDVWRSDGFAFLLLFTVALAFRFVVLVQTSRTPFFEVTNIDSASYQKWARELVAGHWWPTRNFYQSPFYAYFLAVIYRLCGEGPWTPRVVQVVLGSVLPVLTYSIGTRLFSRRVGWIAGGCVCLYGALVLEEVTLNKTSPLMVAAMAGMAAYLRYGPGAYAGGLAVAGACLGLAVQGVAQWLLAFVILAAFLPWMAATVEPRRRWIGLAAFVAAGFVVVAPVVAWNTARGGGLVLTSGGAGLNLYSGNNDRATGLPASPSGLRDIPEYEEEDARKLAEKDLGRPLQPAEVDRYWTGRALTYITSHPGDWLGLLLQKFTVLWNWYEVPDNYQFTFMRAHFLPALYGSVTLAVVGPLALLGLMVPFWRHRGLLAFSLAWLAYGVTPLLYYVRGRYRLPIVPFLAVLAGFGLDRLLRAIAARRWERVTWLGVALAATTLFVNHTYCEPAHHGAQALCFADDIWFDQEWLKLANFYKDRNDLDGTIVAVNRAAAVSVPRSVGQVIFWRGDLERQKGEVIALTGDRAGALTHMRAAASDLRRSVQIKYRVDAATHLLGVVEARIAELQ